MFPQGNSSCFVSVLSSHLININITNCSFADKTCVYSDLWSVG